jgi:hypothetical protein
VRKRLASRLTDVDSLVRLLDALDQVAFSEPSPPSLDSIAAPVTARIEHSVESHNSPDRDGARAETGRRTPRRTKISSRHLDEMS